MLSKSKIRKIVHLILLFWYSVGLAQAGEQIVLSPDGTNSNQKQINEAIKQAATSARGVSVFLTAGIYEVDNTIIMRSNVRLLGDPDAIIRVSSTSSQWFTGRTGVISCQESIKNVEIAGFQMDGNIKNLPSSFADSRSDTDHDCEKLIILGGYSNDFAENIKIHDMKLYNSFSDGIYIIYADGVSCYGNIISNCQHEGIYLSVVKNGHIHDNKIAGITSDCARLDNCQKCLIENNIFFSYGGESYGAYKHGENGLQIADAGSSHGYNAVKKGHPTKDIEVRYNTFSDPGLKAIWYHGGENVYIHDNDFVDASKLETMGVSIGDISIDNQPTLEMTEKVFDSIFDILEVEFTDTGRTDQTAEDVPLQVAEKSSGIIAGGVKIVGFKDRVVIDNVSYIPDDQAVLAQTKVIQNPDFSQWTGIIKQIDKDISVKIENGTAYAKLTVKTHWYTKSKNSLTGKSTKSKIKTSTATFKDSFYPAPEILTRPTEKTGYINEYRSKSNPNTRVYVDPEGLQKIVYEYEGNTSTHTFLIGERLTDEAGVYYTVYTGVDSWDGQLSGLDNSFIIYGPFDPEKLKVTCYTPYENFTIEEWKHNIYELEKKAWATQQTEFILKFLLMLFCGYKLMRIIIPP